MAQDTLLGFPAHTLPYRRGEFTTLSTVSLYRICAKKVRIPPSEISIFLRIRTPDPAGTGRSIFRVFILFARNRKTSRSFFCCNFYKR